MAHALSMRHIDRMVKFLGDNRHHTIDDLVDQYNKKYRRWLFGYFQIDQHFARQVLDYLLDEGLAIFELYPFWEQSIYDGVGDPVRCYTLTIAGKEYHAQVAR